MTDGAGGTPLLRLLQFSDGLFPAGGYAHSFGLETYTAEGTVTDVRGLEAFVVSALEGAIGPCDAVVVAQVHRTAEGRGLTGWMDWDACLDAMKPAAELRAASRQMGRQTLRVATHVGADPRLGWLWDAVEDGRTPGHHAVVFGAAAVACGWTPSEATLGFLYASASVMVNAALRLLSMGQLEGQRLLASLAPRLTRLAAEAVAADEPWGFSPGIESAAMRHSRLDGRLFRS